MRRPGWGAVWIACTCVVGCGGSAAGEAFPLTSGVLAALRGARPYLLRLDDTQRHRACVAGDTTLAIPPATCAAPPAEVLAELAILAPRVGEVLRGQASVDALWAAALLDLASGSPDGRQLDRAIGRLREVRARDSTLAGPVSHLAVAHVARASQRGDARDLFAALDEIERAWERDSASLAIGFNRAAIHSLIGTNRLGRREWEAYRVKESDGSWVAEAGDRLAALPAARAAEAFTLSADGIRHDPQAARAFVMDSLLPAWARATLGADASGASVVAERARVVATGLLALSGDSSVWRIARAIEGSSPGMATGVLHLVDGTLAYRATAFGRARDLLASAVRTLEGPAHAALADWAKLMLGASYMAQQQHEDASRMLAGVAARAAARGDRALQASAFWVGAIAVGRAGRLDESERMFDHARELFSGIGEHRNAATMITGVADAQGAMGRSMEAANSAFRAYMETARAGGAVRYEDLLIGAQQMMEQGHHHASAHLLREAVLAAAEGNRAKDRPESLGRLALAQAAMGRRDLAAATIARAREGARRVDDAAMRSRLDAELHRAESRVVGETDPRRAIALLDSARLYFAAMPIDDGPLLLGRARLSLLAGDSASTGRDLAEAVRVMRGLAPTVAPGAARQIVATLRDAHRTVIELALARGDTAFAYEETVALPTIGPREATPSAMRRRPVAPGRAELRFVVAPGRVLSWARMGDQVSFAETSLPREELTASVARFINLVRSGDDTVAVRSVGAELYRSLLGPHEARLAGVTALDVYTDGVLADLPLAVLTDGGGRYVAERLAVRYVVPAGSRGGAGGKMASAGPLLIGDPTWRRSDFPGLEPLRWADDEVRQIAGLYPNATALSGAGATKQVLLEALPKHEVIHFAGHSRVVVENPERSHLVLAAGGSFGEGVLYASEIAKLDLRGVKLVVLSSCGRTREDASSMGELNGLAMAFLDAGVEAVVAGLWEVEDAGVGVLMRRMHELLESERVEQSLRRAQLSLIRQAVRRGSREAATWQLHVASE